MYLDQNKILISIVGIMEPLGFFNSKFDDYLNEDIVEIYRFERGLLKVKYKKKVINFIPCNNLFQTFSLSVFPIKNT